MELRDSVIYLFFFLILIFLGLVIRYRKGLPISFSWLGAFLMSWLLIDMTATTLSKMGIPNLPLFHINTLLEFVFLTLFYRAIIQKPKLVKQYFKPFFLVFILMIIANTLFIQSLDEFNSYAKTASNLCIICYALLFIYNLFSDGIDQEFRSAYSVINSGLLIYFMGTLLIFLLSDFLLRTNAPFLHDLWLVNICLNIFLMVLLLIGLIQAVKVVQQNSKKLS